MNLCDIISVYWNCDGKITNMLHLLAIQKIENQSM